MFGKTEVTMIAVTTISTIAAYTDLKSGKIFNALTLPAAILGLAAALGDLSGISLLGSFTGIAVGFSLMIWLYALRFLGAGDVKLMMALGAWGGPTFAAETAVLSVIVGAVFAAAILIARGRMGTFIGKLKIWLGSMFVRELRWIRPEWDRSLRMPFGVPIAIAAIAEAFGNPLRDFGIYLW
jgi:prepilin peptidase CpaA